ncbi:MAG: hypothetical protein KJ622_07540 [Alphaproteobacteria bacterium]|nr:hypothetical protein [Alphaproteobacteria bacterium]
MSTLTQSAAWFRDELETISNAAARVLEKIADHQQAKADAIVRPYLARLSEGELVERGFSRTEIAKIKAASGQPLPVHV